MLSVGRTNKKPRLSIPVMATLEQIVDWDHRALTNRKEDDLAVRLLAAWRKDPGYTYYFERKQIKKRVTGVPADSQKLQDRALRYFHKKRDGTYPSAEGLGCIPPRKGNRLNWDCFKKRDMEYSPSVNRFAWMVGMAVGARRSGRVKDMETVFSVMDDWLAQNPTPVDLILGKASVWKIMYKPWAPFNVACRCKHWMEVLHILWDSECLTPERFGRYVTAIRRHVVFLGRVSTRVFKDASHNHFLIEMEGMLNGSLFPWLKEQKSFWDAAVHNIIRCVDKQVLPDGVHCEIAPIYHRACMQWFSKPLLLCRLNKTRLPKEILARTYGMLDFGLHCVAPNGTVFRIADGGVVPDDYASERFVAKCSGRILPIKNIGQSKAALTKASKKEVYPLAKYFPDGGFAAARSSWKPDASSILMKLGRYGGGHSHADYLSFCYAHKGRTILEERGTYGYNDDRKSVSCKYTAAHSVVLVGKREMQETADPKKYFMPRPPCVEIIDVFFDTLAGGGMISGGKVCFADGAWWKRSICFHPNNGLRINDEVWNEKMENIRIQFYLWSEKVKQNRDGSFVTRDKGKPNISIRCMGKPVVSGGVSSTTIYGASAKESGASLVVFDAKSVRAGCWETIIEGS